MVNVFLVKGEKYLRLCVFSLRIIWWVLIMNKIVNFNEKFILYYLFFNRSKYSVYLKKRSVYVYI